MKKNTKLLLFGLSAAAGAAVTAAALDTRLKTVHYKVGSPKINGSVRIAFISDLHNTLYGRGQSQIVGEVDKARPDIVIFGGDLADKTQSVLPGNAIILVRALAAKYPCFYTIGNHESSRGDSKRLKRIFSDMGVTVLEGSGKTIELNGSKIEICGIYDAHTADYDEQRGFVSQLDEVTDIDSENYRILIAHFPEQIEEYLKGGFDMVLSGHAHGGQWAVPGLINGVFAPGQGLFPKYAGGLYTHGDTVHIVSRGLWKPSTPLAVPRIFVRPELVFITIDNYE